MMKSQAVVSFLLLVAVAPLAVAQKAQVQAKPEVGAPVGAVPARELQPAQFLEAAVLMVAGPKIRVGDFEVGRPQEIKGDGVVDTEVTLRFIRDGKRTPYHQSFVWAMTHNVEASRTWRLRRATLHQADKASHWLAGEIVFGRRKRAGKDGPFLELPRGATLLRTALRGLDRRDVATAQCELGIDLKGKSAAVHAVVKVTGDDYKKQFLAFETKVSEANKKTGKAGKPAVFRDVVWRGDEVPVTAKAGKAAKFHLDFLPHKTKGK